MQPADGSRRSRSRGDLRAYIASHAESARPAGQRAFVYERANGDQLVSVLLVLVDAERATVRLANAGHVSPLAVGRSGGVVALEGRGPALGLLPDVDYHDAGPLRLGASMVLLAVSDGVTDAVDRDGHRFGREGVSRVLAASRENGPRPVVRNVLSAVAQFGSPDEADDRTALALRFV